MAKVLDDGDFWLPSQFLTDDDILMDFKASKVSGKSSDLDAGIYFPPEFSSGFGSFGPYSDPSSPVESVVSSTETESGDEEDYLAGLTRKMADSTLQDDLWQPDSRLGFDNQKSWSMAGSPQSTLCGILGGCGCKQGSSRGSPNCPSQVCSPPAAATLNRHAAAWDVLSAAAGEVARMRMIEEAAGYYHDRGLPGPPGKPGPISVPQKNPIPNFGFQPNPSVTFQHLQAAQLQQWKQQQMMKQQGFPVPSRAGGQFQLNQSHQNGQNGGRDCGRPLGLPPSAWPTLQQSQQQKHQGSGMRAVFLGNTGSKRECAGTGVFLPRRVGSPAVSRKRPGCSTVLLPDRVVQALNLNLDTVDAHPQPRSRYNPHHDAAFKHRNNAPTAQQKRSVRPQPVMNPEVTLPQEWTY